MLLLNDAFNSFAFASLLYATDGQTGRQLVHGIHISLQDLDKFQNVPFVLPQNDAQIS